MAQNKLIHYRRHNEEVYDKENVLLKSEHKPSSK